MEDNPKLLESLVDRAAEYGKISYELIKLKALDKASEVVSSVIPHSVVLILLASFLLFLNLGISFWLGEILGKVYFGFFIVAGFYVFVGLIIHFFMYKRIKRIIQNYVIKQLLK
jgi:hypothetical protein